MLEKTLAALFKKKVERKLPDCFYYKFPQPKGGTLTPGDSFLIVMGSPYILEFKVQGRKPTTYQKYMLKKARKAGASTLVITDEDSLNIVIDAIEMSAKYKFKLNRRKYDWFKKNYGGV